MSKENANPFFFVPPKDQFYTIRDDTGHKKDQIKRMDNLCVNCFIKCP
jgi:hypothetical protein